MLNGGDCLLWVIGLAVLCLGVCLPTFLYHKAAFRYGLATAFKALGTLCALVPALVAAIRLEPACYVCVIALALHVIADILIEYNLYWGSGFFLAGHLCYIAFFTKLFSITAVHLICVLVLLAFTGFMFWRWRKAIGKQLVFFIVYGVFLCVMSTCAIAGGITAHTTQGLLIALAGGFFYISDGCLAFRLLYPTKPIINWIIMILYYIAQLLFGISCLLI